MLETIHLPLRATRKFIRERASKAMEKALELNPELLYFASPWSPPGWMKTTGRMIKGTLRPDVTRVTQLIAQELEILIRRAPEQWHCFQPNWPSDPGYGE